MANLIEKLKRHKNKKNGNREKVKTITWNCFAQLLSKYILKPYEMEVSPGSRGCMSNGAKIPPQSSDSQVKVLPSKHPWLPAWNLLGQGLGDLGLPSVCRMGDWLQGDLKNQWNKIIHCCLRGSKKTVEKGTPYLWKPKSCLSGSASALAIEDPAGHSVPHTTAFWAD